MKMKIVTYWDKNPLHSGGMNEQIANSLVAIGCKDDDIYYDKDQSWENYFQDWSIPPQWESILAAHEACDIDKCWKGDFYEIAFNIVEYPN